MSILPNKKLEDKRKQHYNHVQKDSKQRNGCKKHAVLQDIEGQRKVDDNVLPEMAI